MASDLTLDEVARVARLARLKLTEPELQQMATRLGSILEYVRVLDELDVADVEPMAHAVEQRNVLREDCIDASLPRSDALLNAPRTDGRHFLVPPILEGN